MANLGRNRSYGKVKPVVGSQINWGHPLAKGLVGCWLMNERGGRKIIDLSKKRITTFTGNSVLDKLGSQLPSNTGVQADTDYMNLGNITELKKTPFTVIIKVSIFSYPSI